MNDTELRELDAWIADHVMGWKETQNPDDHTVEKTVQFYKHTTKGQNLWRVVVGHPYECRHHPKGKPFKHSYSNYSPTNNPASAMQVLEKCVNELCEQDQEETISVGMEVPYFVVEKTNCALSMRVEAATIPLAICLFAKKLFSK